MIVAKRSAKNVMINLVRDSPSPYFFSGNRPFGPFAVSFYSRHSFHSCIPGLVHKSVIRISERRQALHHAEHIWLLQRGYPDRESHELQVRAGGHRQKTHTEKREQGRGELLIIGSRFPQTTYASWSLVAEGRLRWAKPQKFNIFSIMHVFCSKKLL